jgi:hypothetical protein
MPQGAAWSAGAWGWSPRQEAASRPHPKPDRANQSMHTLSASQPMRACCARAVRVRIVCDLGRDDADADAADAVQDMAHALWSAARAGAAFPRVRAAVIERVDATAQVAFLASALCRGLLPGLRELRIDADTPLLPVLAVAAPAAATLRSTRAGGQARRARRPRHGPLQGPRDRRDAAAAGGARVPRALRGAGP